ncbi:hypothetical protein ACE1CI_14060, partial [Aerosakkonemataceae cyanobacterium BLCC-F50]
MTGKSPVLSNNSTQNKKLMTTESEIAISTPGLEELPVIETHNCYTLYELDEDGSECEEKLLSFSRPQDWADPKRWHYHYCKIELTYKGTHYINHCHIWQGCDRKIFEACKAIAPSLFMFM